MNLAEELKTQATLTMGANGEIINSTGTYKINDERIESQAFYSEQITIADDDFAQIGEIIQDFGMLYIMARSQLAIAVYAIIASPTAAIAVRAGNSNIFKSDAGTSVPDGTSGADNVYTVFVDVSTGNIYLENRIGNEEDFKILVIN